MYHRNRPRTAAVLLMLSALAACKPLPEETAAPQDEEAAVSVVTLKKTSVPLTVDMAGRVVASLEAEVRPQINGIVMQQLFQEGGEVRAGDPLYRIDDASYRADYDSAQASLQKAQAALPAIRAKAQRHQTLLRQNIISRQDAEESRDALEQAKASVAVARAALETARINLDRTLIVAPIAGRSGKSALTPGALVTVGQATALTTLHQLDPINVDMSQSSAHLLALRQAIAAGRFNASNDAIDVTLILEDGSRYPLPGRLKFRESSVDKTTGMYTLRASFPNPDRLLMPGMYVRARVVEATAPGALLIPQRAVSRNARGEATAMRVTEGKVKVQALQLGSATDNGWLVESGLNEGDKVIVEGSQSVSDGAAVNASEVTLDPHSGELHPVVTSASAALQAQGGA